VIILSHIFCLASQELTILAGSKKTARKTWLREAEKPKEKKKGRRRRSAKKVGADWSWFHHQTWRFYGIFSGNWDL
jgi:uncharacterized membrane protein